MLVYSRGLNSDMSSSTPGLMCPNDSWCFLWALFPSSLCWSHPLPYEAFHVERKRPPAILYSYLLSLATSLEKESLSSNSQTSITGQNINLSCLGCTPTQDSRLWLVWLTRFRSHFNLITVVIQRFYDSLTNWEHGVIVSLRERGM